MSDVLVVGAGVIGACVAWNLARRGAFVQVLDRGEPGHGTSATTFAMDITTRKTPRHYFELALHAADLHTELSDQFGDQGWRHPLPSVELGVTEHDHHVTMQRQRRMSERGYPSEVADVADLTELAPSLHLPPRGQASAAVYPGAWYEPDKLVRAMLRDASEFGVDIHHGVNVTGLHRKARKVSGVTTSAGVWEADMVVNCTGPDAAWLAAQAGIKLAIDRIPGIVGHLAPLEPVSLRSMWTLWSLNLRPAPQEQICVHSYEVDAQLDSDSTPTDPVPDMLHQQLRTRLADLLPEVANTGVWRTQIGVRPVPQDGLPLIGKVTGEPRFYTVASHSGVHLAPALGQLAAAEIADGKPTLALAPYRLDRSADSCLPEPRDESMREMNRVLEKPH